jgi:hypothetical protein
MSMKRRTAPSPAPDAGWGVSPGHLTDLGAAVRGAGGPRTVELDVFAPGPRAGGSRPLSAGVAAAESGSAPMGGRTPAKDLWGDGMINEGDRGGAHDYRRTTEAGDDRVRELGSPCENRIRRAS